jgi:large conductance mechanosensitive channel
MLGEFQQFLAKTNAIALAIGVIIGGTTTKLVTGIVEYLINPVIGALLANVNLSDIKIVLGTIKNAQGQIVENALRIGDLVSLVINFVIVMAVVFIIARLVVRKMLDGDIVDAKKVKDKATEATKSRE